MQREALAAAGRGGLERATNALDKLGAATDRAARTARLASRSSVGVLAIWVVGLLLVGWLTGPLGVVVLVLVGALWVVAWFGARNLAAALETISGGVGLLHGKVSAVRDHEGGIGGISDEALRMLASVDGDRLSLFRLRSVFRGLKGGLGTVDSARSLSFVTYAYGLLSYVLLGCLLAVGLVFVVVGIL